MCFQWCGFGYPYWYEAPNKSHMNEDNFKIKFAIRKKCESQFSVNFFKDRFNAALLLLEILYV